jgi:hypothetical protein
MSTPRFARISAITSGVALILGLSASAAAADNSLEITVNGLPAKAKLTKAPKIFLMGPWGKKDTSTRRVGRHTTITGLRAGTYMLTAAPISTKSGTLLSTRQSMRPVTVGTRSTTNIRVRYVQIRALPTASYRIDMPNACRFLFGNTAEADYRSSSDASSWFCRLPDRSTYGMDLERYCRHLYGRDTGARFQGGSIYNWFCFDLEIKKLRSQPH